jgi:glycosyltransferase involved in cell wall biosynthesis
MTPGEREGYSRRVAVEWCLPTRTGWRRVADGADNPHGPSPVIRVLLDCRMASWSGVGRYATGLARALAARADIELIQVCAAGEPPPAPPTSQVSAVAASAHPFGLHGALELGRLVRGTDPDLVHCLHFPTPWPTQAPLVVTLHDLIPLVVSGVMPSLPKRLIYRMWNARAASAANLIIVASRATRQDVARLFPAAEDKLVVTPYAADDFSSGPASQLAGRLAQLISTPYLLAMGNTKPHKDLPTLLNAFGIVASSFPDLRLLLVGSEPAGYLEIQLAGVPNEIATRVVFSGPISDAELRTLYAGAAVFVCPSRYEGFGLPALEAMALGAPVVCADAASLPEVVGDAALLFPPGEQVMLADAVARILRDQALRHQIVTAGRSRAAQLTWANTAAATVAVYSAVLHDSDVSSSGWGRP